MGSIDRLFMEDFIALSRELLDDMQVLVVEVTAAPEPVQSTNEMESGTSVSPSQCPAV
ncbi:MAG TPA: hypothetical protein VHY84_19375 [Bryobacteraceae bacterium]|nr:hypothetical protein [Bryobacteraceae bacterium]